MAPMIKHFSKQKRGTLSIDNTFTSKPYSEKLPGVWAIFDVVLGTVGRGFRKVVAAWSNGDVTIPIQFQWYFCKAVVGEHYKTKSQIADEICSKNSLQ